MMKRLFNRRKLTVLGINSGTSADGIDLAVINLSKTGQSLTVKYDTGKTISYPKKIKSALENAITDYQISAEQTTRLDIAYGDYLGKAARQFIDSEKLKIDLIASHGQTLFHFPHKEKTLLTKSAATIQIGDGNALAAASGLPVVSDFRRADIALGGEGAPLTPFVNRILFGDKTKSRIIVNIGGIANYSYHPAGGKIDDIKGGDCGPGNTLVDNACRLLVNKPYDRDGRIASKGIILPEVVAVVIEANHRNSVSTGRKLFDRELLARAVHAAGGLRAEKKDIVASLTYATARLIYERIKKLLSDRKLEAVYLAGGGRKNKFLVKQLADLCQPMEILPVDKLGYNGDLLEAVSFAVLGARFVYNFPSTLPGVTGAVDKGGVAGKLALPPIKKR